MKKTATRAGCNWLKQLKAQGGGGGVNLTLPVLGLVAALCAAACEAPSGIQAKAADWTLHVPVGTVNFSGDSGFSLGKLKASDIQENIASGNAGAAVYDGKDGNTEIWVQPDSNKLAIKGSEQQTYLISFPIPMEQDIKSEIQKSFTDTLKSQTPGGIPADGYITQPQQSVPIDIKVSSISNSREFKITKIEGLVYDVRLTFSGSLPEKNQNFVKFDASPAATVDDSKEGEKVLTWRSAPKTVTTIGSNTTISTIKLDLPVGAKYKPELEFYSWTGIEVQFTGEAGKSMGSTSALSDLMNMLGGAEFEQAWMYIFSGDSASNITVKAEHGKPSDNDYSTITLINGMLTSKQFDKDEFYGTELQNVTASADPVNVASGDKNILGKNAPSYELKFSIPTGTTITLTPNSGIEMVLLVPLKFKVEKGGDITEVTGKTTVNNQTEEKRYLKLAAGFIDNMLGDTGGGQEFDLTKQVEETKLGTLRKADVNLTIANKAGVLPPDLTIGIKDGDKYNVIGLKDNTKSKLDVRDMKTIPSPALLVGPLSEGENTADTAIFKIPSVEDKEGEISVQIIADVTLDLKYEIEL
ncbi:MAG: hypothetical protein LBG72_02375 [Spirochaetaceae bacterium]|jgi:hypothetical protein|nr:hypothetical protein [Spirochaetaceae bacterium]